MEGIADLASAEKEQRNLEAIAAVIREHYDLGKVATPALFAAAHQWRHRKMVVDTDAGRFLAKTYRRDTEVLDSLLFQQRLSDHLAENGLPVARIQRARDGRGVVEVGDWALELQQFIQATSMAVNTSSLKQSGWALGRFHVACHGFAVPPRDTRMWRFSEVPRESFQNLYHAAREQGAPERIDKYCNEIALFLQEARQALSIEKRSEFETGLIHGDWHGGNLLFEGERLAAIVDLEFAGDGCYLEDIAYAISNLCVRTSTNIEKIELRTNILMDQYQIHRSLSFSERFALYYAVGIKQVATVSYQMRQRKGEPIAGLTVAEWMEHLAIQCRWLANQGHRVRFGIK